MKYTAAVSLYKKACKKMQDLKPLKIREADCIQDKAGGWRLITVLDGVRGPEKVLVGLVHAGGGCLVGRALKGHLARQQQAAINNQIWATKTLPELCERRGVAPPKPITPQKPAARPNLAQKHPAPAQPRDPFARK